jgi:hypothetical protein
MSEHNELVLCDHDRTVTASPLLNGAAGHHLVLTATTPTWWQHRQLRRADHEHTLAKRALIRQDQLQAIAGELDANRKAARRVDEEAAQARARVAVGELRLAEGDFIRRARQANSQAVVQSLIELSGINQEQIDQVRASDFPPERQAQLIALAQRSWEQNAAGIAGTDFKK